MNKNLEKKQESKEKLYEEIDIPNEIEVQISDCLVIRKGDKELRRKLNPLLIIKKENNKLILSTERKRKIEKKIFGTFVAHIKNMIKGVLSGFTYKLQVANVHFPMKVSYDRENNSIFIKNFLGEKKDRIIKISPDVDVKINNDIIELFSFDIEKAGQSATNIEKGTRVRNKDRRIYQDGIFIIQKPGKVYL